MTIPDVTVRSKRTPWWKVMIKDATLLAEFNDERLKKEGLDDAMALRMLDA